MVFQSSTLRQSCRAGNNRDVAQRGLIDTNRTPTQDTLPSAKSIHRAAARRRPALVGLRKKRAHKQAAHEVAYRFIVYHGRRLAPFAASCPIRKSCPRIAAARQNGRFRLVGPLDLAAYPCVAISARAIHYSRRHKRSGFAAGAPRRRSAVIEALAAHSADQTLHMTILRRGSE